MKSMDRIVVVGASAAGLASAETLRREGFDGELVMVGDEVHFPYDRPPLSKQVMSRTWPSERVFLRKEAAIRQLDAQWRLGVRAVGLSVTAQTVFLSNGIDQHFDGLVIATGVTPRRLSSGHELAGVHVLKTLDDAIAIRDGLGQSRRLVVVGAGFLGSEVAASAAMLGVKVTLVDPLPVPMTRQLGADIGRLIASLHERHGIELRLGVGVAKLVGESGHVTGVQLDDGTVVAADLVLVAVGSSPNTGWLVDSGVTLGNGVECDEYCRAAPGIVAAGDVASWYHLTLNTRLRVEHRTNATEHGAAAAHSLLGVDERPFVPVPFFWTDQYDVKIQMYGVPGAYTDTVIVRGDVADGRFALAYRRNGRTCAFLAWNMPRESLELRAQLVADLAVDASDVAH
jgi:3-phenylpropionate/trans-cinnamate dioxygenase ferredoxin reductase subunit